jgi:hypothetical protein
MLFFNGLQQKRQRNGKKRNEILFKTKTKYFLKRKTKQNIFNNEKRNEMKK